MGAECVNASDAFAGCEMGQANSCAGPQSPHQWQHRGRRHLGAFHPTQRGQQILGQLIDHEIQNPPPGTGGPLRGPGPGNRFFAGRQLEATTL